MSILTRCFDLTYLPLEDRAASVVGIDEWVTPVLLLTLLAGDDENLAIYFEI